IPFMDGLLQPVYGPRVFGPLLPCSLRQPAGLGSLVSSSILAKTRCAIERPIASNSRRAEWAKVMANSFTGEAQPLLHPRKRLPRLMLSLFGQERVVEVFPEIPMLREVDHHRLTVTRLVHDEIDSLHRLPPPRSIRSRRVGAKTYAATGGAAFRVRQPKTRLRLFLRHCRQTQRGPHRPRCLCRQA